MESNGDSFPLANERVPFTQREEAHRKLGEWFSKTTQPLRKAWLARAHKLGLTDKEATIFANYYTNRDTMHMTHGWRSESKAECKCFDLSDDEILAEVKRLAGQD